MVYASGRSLYVAGADGDNPRKLLTAEGVPSGTRWSPDGQRIRFSVYDPGKGMADSRTLSGSLWEVSSSGADLHPLLAGWNNPPGECCGNWTPDGKYFVFGSNREKRNDIWVIRERSGQRKGQPVRLTAGPVEFSTPVPGPDGKQLFVVGTQVRGEVLRYDLASRQFVPFLSGISATDVSPSADGQWITYVTYPKGTLWRSKPDGGDRLQLTFPPMDVGLPRWSPDDTRIAFTGQMPGQPTRIYLVSRDGGNLQQVTSEERHEADPNWSPDGKSLVFGRLPFLERGAYGPTAIHLVDIESRRISTLPGSEGLFSPHWSPDGRYIEAVSNDGQQMMLFDFQGNKWTEVVKMQVEYPNWSRDGQHVYFCNSRDHGMYRVRVNERKVEKLTGLENLGGTSSVFVNWCGLAADDSPLVQRDNTTEEIYALDVELP